MNIQFNNRQSFGSGDICIGKGLKALSDVLLEQGDFAEIMKKAPENVTFSIHKAGEQQDQLLISAEKRGKYIYSDLIPAYSMVEDIKKLSIKTLQKVIAF